MSIAILICRKMTFFVLDGCVCFQFDWNECVPGSVLLIWWWKESQITNNKQMCIIVSILLACVRYGSKNGVEFFGYRCCCCCTRTMCYFALCICVESAGAQRLQPPPTRCIFLSLFLMLLCTCFFDLDLFSRCFHLNCSWFRLNRIYSIYIYSNVRHVCLNCQCLRAHAWFWLNGEQIFGHIFFLIVRIVRLGVLSTEFPFE